MTEHSTPVGALPVPTDPDHYVRRQPTADPGLAAAAADILADLESLPVYRSTIGCVIPAYNEAETIAGVLDSLLSQTRLPDTVHVVINNSSDDSLEIASHYAGLHTRTVNGVEEFTEVFVHDIGENPDKKVGALNYGYTLVEGMDFFLGVDGDTTADPRAVEFLLDEIEKDARIGGISAIYSIDASGIEGIWPKFLIAGQRQQFASFNMQNLLQGRHMAVLGGQFSIFRMEALARVVEQSHQRYPWVKDSEIEDSLLSLQIKSAGYLTKISANARADVGGMLTFQSLDAQQVKWNTGAIDLMWPGQRGDTKGQPFHPNLRLRWFEMGSMLLNVYTRFAFITLLVCALLFSAFDPHWMWLVPPMVSTYLNFRIARSMASASRRDYLFALTWLPSEAYIWTRMGHFLRSWAKFFSGTESDNWALQSKAERGGGNRAFLTPLLVALILVVAVAAIFMQLSVPARSDFLYFGWNLLAMVTIGQTAWLSIKCLRRYRGFKA